MVTIERVELLLNNVRLFELQGTLALATNDWGAGIKPRWIFDNMWQDAPWLMRSTSKMEVRCGIAMITCDELYNSGREIRSLPPFSMNMGCEL